MLSRAFVKGMLRTDGLRLRRDRFLIGTAVYIVAVSIAMRWAIPWLTAELAARLDFDLVPYYSLALSHILLQLTPLLGAIIGGFLLLEGREDRTVKALLVSPVPVSTYVALFCLVIFVVTAVLIFIEGAIIAIALPPWPAFFATSLAAAPAAPALALFIAAVSHNKTEAFAYLKICGAAPLVPSGCYFLPEPWQWLAGIYPPYWASKAYWIAEAGGRGWPLWVLGGLVTSAIWVAMLGRAFVWAARRGE